MKAWKKGLIAAAALGLSLAMLTGCGSDKKDAGSTAAKAGAQIVQVKSEKEADLIEAAKKEGVVKVYSITSRVSKGDR